MKIPSLITAIALGATAHLCVTTIADAAVIRTPGISEASHLVIPNDFEGVYLNVVTGDFGTDEVPGWQLNPYSSNAGNNYLDWWGVSDETWLSPTGVETGNIAIPLGAIVGSAGVYINPGGDSSTTIGDGPGEFRLNAVNYVGFRFDASGETPGSHYGYLAILLGDSFGERSIVGSYYESEVGVEIEVGAIPEPSAVLLFAGAAGLMALYRQRRSAAR